MKNEHSTFDLLAVLALATVILLAMTAALNSCAPRAYPPGPNPLDEPGFSDPTAAELHAKNIRLIRGHQ